MKVVITQSMFFPWVGLLEQIRLADIVVHYDDVQFSKGSFVNRVQIKSTKGTIWMTVPLKELHLGQKIEDVQIDSGKEWKQKHYELIADSFQSSPYKNETLDLVKSVYQREFSSVGTLARASFRALIDYFEMDNSKTFIDVKDLGIDGKGSQRVLDIVKAVRGNTYITGHGASKYLDHGIFEDAGITVEYMKYMLQPYSQLNGEFTPYTTGLDLVANCGKSGVKYVCSDTINWRDYFAT